jgi:hypothetical protein
MLGIYIDNMKDQHRRTDVKGKIPFATWSVERNGRKVYFSELYPTYDG